MRIFPPFSSASENTRPSASAAVRARSTSSAVVSVSTMSSRGADWIPILTSTTILSAAIPSRDACDSPARNYFMNRCARSTRRHPDYRTGSPGERPAADAAPGQPAQQLLRGILGDIPAGAHPVPGADVGHSDEPHPQQVRLVVLDPGVLADHPADHFRALVHRGIQPLPHGRLIAKI